MRKEHRDIVVKFLQQLLSIQHVYTSKLSFSQEIVRPTAQGSHRSRADSFEDGQLRASVQDDCGAG